MSEHSPAPWEYVREGSSVFISPNIARVNTFNHQQIENARLIAAAPDLYSNTVRVRDYVRACLIDNDFDCEAVSALECIEKMLVDALEPLEPDQGFWDISGSRA